MRKWLYLLTCLVVLSFAACSMTCAEVITYRYQYSITLIAENTSGNTIGSWTNYMGSSECVFDSALHPDWQLPLDLYLGDAYMRPDSGDYYGTLFDFGSRIALVPNVGQTFWVSSEAQDAGYSAFVAALTNPQAGDRLGVATIMADGHGWSSMGVGQTWQVDDPSTNHVIGASVGRIGLRIDSASFSAVPEPATILSLLAGIGGFGLSVRRARKS